MSDGTQLNTGAGGDLIRDITRPTVTTPGAATSAGYQQANTTQKTQIVALDLGGASGSGEFLVDVGIAPASQSLPVVLASDQQSLPHDRISAFMATQLLKLQIAQISASGGFVPIEIPEFLAGL